MLQHADGHAAEHVDEKNQDAGDGVAANELAGTVHGTVEVGFSPDVFPTLTGLVLRQQSGVEVGVDGHLLAGQGVQGEARGHFRDATGTLGDDHEVDDDEDGEDDDADRVVAADHEFAEGLDDLACRARAVVAFHQHHARGGDVQAQSQQGGHEQDGREHAEIHGPVDVDDGEQDHQRQRDVEGEEQVQQERRHRQHQHRQQRQDEHENAQSVLAEFTDAVLKGQGRCCHVTLRSRPACASCQVFQILVTDLGHRLLGILAPQGFPLTQLVEVRQYLGYCKIQARWNLLIQLGAGEHGARKPR